MLEFRLKVVRSDGSHYFSTHNFKRFGASYELAMEIAHAVSVSFVDIYFYSRKIATFYH